jgi:signal transduction histidine kinase
MAFGAFFVASVVLMATVPQWQGVPFHLVWAGVTILYAYRQWSPRATGLLLAALCLATGAVIGSTGAPSRARLLELADLPMMALMFLVMVQVVHQRTEALRRARRAADRERDFVRDASHQLRTPITIARGHAELVARVDPESEVARDAEVVLEELARLQRISDRLLLLASAEERGSLLLEPVPLGQLVHAAARRWTAVADREWIVDGDVDGRVLVDSSRIDCALDTLIENAIKATSPGEAIAIRASARGGVPALLVADRGVGVPCEQRERIFERFARGTPSSRGAWSGTGLGLPIVRAIAEAHGGSARLTTAPAGWTVFELRLARFEPEPSMAQTPLTLADAALGTGLVSPK